MHDSNDSSSAAFLSLAVPISLLPGLYRLPGRQFNKNLRSIDIQKGR